MTACPGVGCAHAAHSTEPDGSRGAPKVVGLLVFSAIILALSLLPLVAHCDPTPTPAPSGFWRSSTISGTTFMPGQDRKLLFGARASAGLALPWRCALLARVDASALSDGGALDVTFDNPESFSTIEGTAALTRELRGGISAAVAYGYTLPVEAGKLAIVERYPRTWMVGFAAIQPDGFVMAGVGEHQASGRGTRLLFAGQRRVEGRTSFGVDGAVGTHSLIRAYVLVQVAGGQW